MKRITVGDVTLPTLYPPYHSLISTKFRYSDAAHRLNSSLCVLSHAVSALSAAYYSKSEEL